MFQLSTHNFTDAPRRLLFVLGNQPETAGVIMPHVSIIQLRYNLKLTFNRELAVVTITLSNPSRNESMPTADNDFLYNLAPNLGLPDRYFHILT